MRAMGRGKTRLWVEAIVEIRIDMVRLEGDDRFERIGMGGKAAVRPHDVLAKGDGGIDSALIMPANGGRVD